MKNTLLVAASLFLLLGCATAPVSNEDAVLSKNIFKNDQFQLKEGNATLIVKRDKGFSGSGCSSRVYVNGSAAADLDSGEYFKVSVIPGNYIISAQPNGVCGGGMFETKVSVIKDEVATYRIGYGSNGDYFIVPTAF